MRVCIFVCSLWTSVGTHTCLVSLWSKCHRTILIPWSFYRCSLRNASLLWRCWEMIQGPHDYTPKALSHLSSTKILIIWVNFLEYWGTFSRKDAYPTQTQTTVLYTLKSYSTMLISSSLSPQTPLQVFAIMSRKGSAPCSSSHWWKLALDFSFRLECNYGGWSVRCFFIWHVIWCDSMPRASLNTNSQHDWPHKWVEGVNK